MEFLNKRLGVALCALALAWAATPPAQAADERQYKVESAFLYGFFNYITWPSYESPGDMKRAVICVYGGDPVLKYLEYVKRKMAEERTLYLRRVDSGSKLDGCNIIFVRDASTAAMEAIAHSDAVTVSMSEDFLYQGGAIELTHNQERITFKINKSLLSGKGYQLSSRLLALAQNVQ